MQISRRDLFRSSAAVAGVAALGGFGSLAADAVAGTGPSARAVATRTAVLLRGKPDATTGWRKVVTGPGETYLVRSDLGQKPKSGRGKRRKALIAFAQLSDVHICDHQSPLRYEYGDPDVSGSAYRPQEMLTAQIADSMVREINQIAKGPVTGSPLALAIQTGDNSDNTQRNEIRWNIDVLDGGTIRSDSGDLTRYEGVMDGVPEYYDPYYWHPEGTPEGLEDDAPRAQHGFPVIPGLLDAARAPFEAEGLSIPWYTAFGNHDGLVQGNWNGTLGTYATQAVGTTKITTKGDREVTADPNRRLLNKTEWIEEHFTTVDPADGGPGPVGHGFTEDNRANGTGYYSFDRGLVRFVVLDSVNPNYGQNGSIDPPQFAWLKSVLAKSSKKLVIVASHHTIDTMDNGITTDIDPRPRIKGDKIRAELLKHDTVIGWVNGHTHTNHIWAHSKLPAKKRDGSGFWEINTASHIDWPQQSRLIEVTDNKDGTVSIFATMLDHGAPLEASDDLSDPVQLASLAREIAANDWQEQHKDRRGKRNARNVELLLKAPRFLR